LQERGIILILCGVGPDLAKALHDTGLDAEIRPEHCVLESADPDTSTQAGLAMGRAVLRQELERDCLEGRDWRAGIRVSD
jgi:hypothetical protein